MSLSATTTPTDDAHDGPRGGTGLSAGTNSTVFAGETRNALEEPPLVAPPPKPGARWPANTALFRMRRYLLPYKTRYVWMVFFAVTSTLASLVVPLVTKAVVDGPIAHADRPGLLILGAAAIAIGLTEGLLMFARRWIVSRATLGTEAHIRLDEYGALQRLPMSFHNRWQSGQLLSRVMNDLSVVRRFLGFGLIFLFTSFMQVVIVTLVLLHMYWPLGLIVVVTCVPVTWMCLVNSKKFTRLSRKIQDETGDVASAVEEMALGIRVIKSFGRNKFTFDKFDRRSVTLFGTWWDRIKLASLFWTFLEVIPSLSLILVLGVGAWAAGTGHISLGSLVAFITLMLSLINPMASLGFLLAQAQEAMTAADRVAEILDEPNPIVDGPLELPEVDGRPQVTGELAFHDVAYRFDDGDTDVLHHINLQLRPGETVALVGGTGSGKTTFTSLVARLADVTHGSITIDGIDIREMSLRQLRTVVATAFEDPTLFSMSARENLLLGRPDASEEDLAEAIEVAQAHFVYDLPWGLDTRLGEQGMSLSGGQRQRLALARAVLVKPSVLVLDDTLSALDIHTEELVEAALKRVLKGVTGIVVAHRASTVLLADRVAMLSEGTIAHVGTHSDLLATVPAYRELLSADFVGDTELQQLGLDRSAAPDDEQDREGALR